MFGKAPERDERETAVDLAADRLSYLVLSYGLLVIVAYRAFVLDQASWDLLGLVIVGGLVGVAYRFRSKVVARGWAAVVVATVVLGATAAAIMALAGFGR